jgi:hypothetical protein
LPLSESVRLFADLMSVPLPEDRYPCLPMTAQQQRDATLDAIVAWLIEVAEQRQPLFQDRSAAARRSRALLRAGGRWHTLCPAAHSDA